MRVVDGQQPSRPRPATSRAVPCLAAPSFAALPAEAVVLDPDGVVVLANEAWYRYGQENGAGARCGIGSNYLQVCVDAARSGEEQAGVVAAALSAVLDGHAPVAELDYPCHSPDAQRWFRLRATRLPGRDQVLVVHDEITDHVEQQTRLQHAATHDSLTGLAKPGHCWTSR